MKGNNSALNHAASEAYCKRAVLLSRVAEDRTLEAAALKHQAVKYFDLNHPHQTLQTYQEALQFVDQVSPLMQSRTYLGLSAAYAQLGQQQDALRYLGMAQETFPEEPEKDVSFTYADCGPSSLNHYGGLIYMELDQPQKAWETFAEVEKLKQRIVIPERTNNRDCKLPGRGRRSPEKSGTGQFPYPGRRRWGAEAEK